MGMQLIETVELDSAASSIEFTSIPQDGVDLLLKVSGRSDRAATSESMTLAFNGSTSDFSFINLRGQGSSVNTGSGTGSVQILMQNGDTSTASTFGNAQVYVSNYASSSAKSFSSDGVNEGNIVGTFQSLQANLWNNTAAITSVSVSPTFGTNWLQYSTASLYKITAD